MGLGSGQQEVSMLSQAANSGVKLTASFAQFAAVVFSGHKKELEEWMEHGVIDSHFMIPREMQDDFIMTCDLKHIPVSVIDSGDAKYVTVVSRGPDAFTINEAGQKIPIDGHAGDRLKLEPIVAAFNANYNHMQALNDYQMKVDEANKLWQGRQTMEISDLSFREAQMFIKIANDRGVQTFLTYHPEDLSYGVQVDASAMKRGEFTPDIQSQGELLLQDYVYTTSNENIAKYIEVQTINDEFESKVLTAAKLGLEHEPIVMCSLDADMAQRVGARPHHTITIDGSNAQYLQVKHDPITGTESEFIQNFDLSNPEQYEAFKKEVSFTMKSRCSMTLNQFDTCISDRDVWEAIFVDPYNLKVKADEAYVFSRRIMPDLEANNGFNLNLTASNVENTNWQMIEIRASDTSAVVADTVAKEIALTNIARGAVNDTEILPDNIKTAEESLDIEHSPLQQRVKRIEENVKKLKLSDPADYSVATSFDTVIGSNLEYSKKLTVWELDKDIADEFIKSISFEGSDEWTSIGETNLQSFEVPELFENLPTYILDEDGGIHSLEDTIDSEDYVIDEEDFFEHSPYEQ